MRLTRRAPARALALVWLTACTPTPWAVRVVDFAPGDGAGFGQDRMPDVVLGPPVAPPSTSQGSTDVVSLGAGGSIVVEMGEEIVDGDGPDLIVFENAFTSAVGDFTEPGEVAVSADGATFVAFGCAPADDPPNGCAGFTPTTGDVNEIASGGDAFDLATIGVAHARFVRVVDVGGAVGAEGTAGFDLDAVAVVAR